MGCAAAGADEGVRKPLSPKGRGEKRLRIPRHGDVDIRVHVRQYAEVPDKAGPFEAPERPGALIGRALILVEGEIQTFEKKSRMLPECRIFKIEVYNTLGNVAGTWEAPE